MFSTLFMGHKSLGLGLSLIDWLLRIYFWHGWLFLITLEEDASIHNRRKAVYSVCLVFTLYIFASCLEVGDWLLLQRIASLESHSDAEESKIHMLLPMKSSWNVYSSGYINGLEIVYNMIMNKAAEVWSKWGRVDTHTYRHIHRRQKKVRDKQKLWDGLRDYSRMRFFH